MGVPLWWALWLGIRVLLPLLTGQGPRSNQTELLFVRGRNTPGRFVAHLKNDWAWNGDCLDYTETHPLISFSGPQKAWWHFSPSQRDLMPKVSVTHLHREAVFREKGISFISMWCFSPFILFCTFRSAKCLFLAWPHWMEGQPEQWWRLSVASRFLKQGTVRVQSKLTGEQCSTTTGGAAAENRTMLATEADH